MTSFLATAPPALTQPPQYCELQPGAESPKHLRHWVSVLLDAWLLPHLKDDLALIATELASNAVRHGGSPAQATLSLTHDDLGGTRVRLEVTDAGAGFDPSAAVAAWNESGTPASCHGRGLLLVAALSERWGSNRLDTGQRVWAELIVG